MKLLLKSLNYAPELTGIGKYNGEMCEAFVERGVGVTAVVAPPYYPEWQIHQGYRKFWFKSEIQNGVELIRCPLYVPKKVTTFKRLLHLATFAFSSGLALFSRLFKKPDVIILVQPTLFCAPFTLLYAKLTGTKTVLHIQDFEVDAIFGLGLMGDGKAASVAKKIERWLMSGFDAVSTISFSMMDNAKSKGVPEDKLIHFPNWSDTSFVTPETDGSGLREEWGFSNEDKIVLYAGNMGAKQGLEIVLEAAKALRENIHIKLVFVGAGSIVDQLKSMADELHLSNVHFKPLQPWELVPQLLAMADIHLVIQKKGAADAVLPSKLTNILSAGGHAIVTAEEHTELGRIEKLNPGIYECIEPESIDTLVTAIGNAITKDTKEHNKVARQFALSYLDKNTIIDTFLIKLEKITESNSDFVKEIK
ncbi:glycosyltransferase WbuB [Aliiglaciecola sp. 2_MG-2023]|uniref:glycosyltransferase WbuB n=1 Tax=unclassified Aliiglaciecola TaxID=2593648 RepID=UPI0026E438BE|nr:MULTISPECIES: glycosyltransferase WbuB [unclassified Aliiglaciecola]MDO6712876.1 glycosyltransferase WbuB [Aliiglaciecola sp. 2_MG-2023]MDO6752888.1 glycosyltransferase WbuB [Aliiglaciecola sp. 1_MG-2023]